MRLTEINITRAVSKQIQRKSISEFRTLIDLVEEGISLLIKTTEFLEKLEPSIDKNTEAGASKAAAWRFLSTLPTTAILTLEASECGLIALAKYLLRLCLEESISLAFYVELPNEALSQINRDTDRDKIDFGEKVERLNLPFAKEIKKLWGGLSSVYSHANLVIQHELMAKDDDGNVYLVGGPIYLPDQFQAIQKQLLIILGNALKYILFRFEKLHQNDHWRSRFEKFLYAAELETAKL
jgi:hypothetical protein